jgi:hypothetical protein
LHNNECGWRRNALHTESRQYLGNAYRNVTGHTATNLQTTVTAKNAITLLLNEMISIRFDKNQPQRGNWLTQDRKDKRQREVRSEVFTSCGVVTVTFRVLLFVVTKCYSYSKIVLQLTVVPPGEYSIVTVTFSVIVRSYEVL